jgi:sialate O-acetylesterase
MRMNGIKRVEFGRMVVAGLLAVVMASAARAEVTVSKVFGNGMVIQQDKPIRVWGEAERGEQVTVEFAGKTGAATADPQGHWRVELPR